MANSNRPEMLFEASLDGINYAIFRHNGHIWRVGSLIPWRPALADLGQPPSSEELKAFQAQKIWLAPENPSPPALIAMCCGMGALWPGVGRELYVNFPVAARAMEDIARLSEWDLLALLDESGQEKINQTRWQIPYLFMLEYAQWSLLKSLGLKPAIFCGHSLGELLALCFAGVYSLKSAWHLLDTRAMHMARLEAASDGESGMLAVPGDMATINGILEQWPDLKISNRNTEKQYILSGSRTELLEARRQLRRNHIPAVMLNMDLAFHNPAMRILRTVSMLRLNGLTMAKSEIPVISCVDGQPYPHTRPEICKRIADLDENTVDWVNLMEILKREFPTPTFLEFGPQEILCGITSELCPDSVCMAVDRKTHEAQAMMEACARLFSLGYLSPDAIAKLVKNPVKPGSLYIPASIDAPQTADPLAGVSNEDLRTILDLLAEATHKNASDINPNMDLRQDLGLGSSHFPFLMLEAEERLGKPVILENLFKIVTVADLARFLTGASAPDSTISSSTDKRPLFIKTRLPLHRYTLNQQMDLRPAPYNLRADGIAKNSCKHIITLCEDSGLKPIMGSLETLGASLYLDGAAPVPEIRPDGFILVLSPNANETRVKNLSATLQELLNKYKSDGHTPWVCIIKRFAESTEPDSNTEQAVKWLKAIQQQSQTFECPIRFIALLDGPFPCQNPDETGQLLVLELLHGKDELIVWQRKKEAANGARFCAASGALEQVYPLSGQKTEESGVFMGECQFSQFKYPNLASHGTNAQFTPLIWNPIPAPYPHAPWLPLAHLFENMRLCARNLYPDFDVMGFTDFRIFEFPAIPECITRECELYAKSHFSLFLEDVPVNPCHIELKIAQITANGRKTGDMQPLADGSCIMTGRHARFYPLWEPDFCGDPHDPKYLELFYDTLALGHQWQTLKALTKQSSHAWSAELSNQILENCKSPWDLRLAIIDASLLAVLAARGLNCHAAEELYLELSGWRLASIGVIRFNDIKFTAHSPFRLEWRKSWDDNRLQRYDFQAISGDQIFMYILNLELTPFNAS